ncbi:MAG: hypothetical protein KGZ83_08090 [Sulfuricella sp.]|nr:hypothetical protein [Sulfuricella sp.]
MRNNTFIAAIFGWFFLFFALACQAAPYTADANTVLLDHFDGTTGASILAYRETGAACGSQKPSATPSSSFGTGPSGLNQALTLNPPVGQPAGSGSYLQYPGGQLLSQSNGTIEFWTYLTAYGTGVSLVDQGPFPGSCAGWTFGMSVTSTGQLTAGAWAAFSMNSGTTIVPLNTWTHVAATWGSTGAKLYINGVQVGSDVNTGMPASGFGGSVLINYSARDVTTRIDELRISNIQRVTFDTSALLAAGTLQFSSASYSVNENAGAVTITITRTGGSSGIVSAEIGFVASGSTAQVDVDFSTAIQGVTFADGDTTPKTISIPIINDSLVEGNETFRISFSTGSPTGGAALGSPSIATVTIVDDDSGASSGFAFSGSATGDISNLTLVGNVQVASGDVGKNGMIFAAANVAGSFYFKSGGGIWTLWSGGALESYYRGVLNTGHSIPIVQNLDLRFLQGTNIYLGYGLTEADMVLNTKYAKIYTISADTTPADGVSIGGNVFIAGTSTPIVGATISTSLDSKTATTDAAGHFFLQTQTAAAKYATTPYTIAIIASGYLGYSQSGNWGGNPTNQVFYLTPTAVSPPSPVVGAKFSMASNWASAGAAFDGINYLLAMESDTAAARVAAQMVSSDGTRIGPVIETGHSGQSCCAAGIAFDGSNYLMVWEEDQGVKNSWTPFMIYGQFISTASTVIGQPFALTTAGITLDGMNVLAYGGGKYLLTYTRLIVPASGGASNNRYIAGRIISPDGSMGEEFRISTGFGAKNSMVFDGTNFFVVWIEDSQDFEVRGRRVSPSGALGQEISINASPAPSDNPVAVAFDGTNYLVAWNDEVGGKGTQEWDILAQRVSPNGSLVGEVISIVTEPGAQRIPGLAFDGTNYLVTWSDAKNDTNKDGVCDAGEGTCWDVYGRFIGKDGTLVGSKFAINTDAGNQFGGVGGNRNGKYLVIVNSGITMGKGGPSQVGEVYGVFIKP